jgi:hypothetical protein
MTSHYRHRRIFDPATAFPTPVEPGEIVVNSANRQIAVGDADPASPGATKPLLAVRVFDAKAQYAQHDFVVQAGVLYRSNTAVSPGAFNATQWDSFVSDSVSKAYIDAGDAAVGTAFQNADASIITDYQAADAELSGLISGKVDKTGDTMTGALILVGAPTAALQAATKKYVDDVVAAGGPDATAADIINVPAGGIASINVQGALYELDNEKANLASPNFTGAPTAPTPPVNDNDTSIATTAFVLGQVGTAAPVMDGTVPLVGVSQKYAREDHAHPTDTTRAPIDSPNFIGTPTAPTPAPGDNDTSIATTAFVQNVVSAATSGFSTGDAKLTLKTIADAGWVMMNDGTIGDASSGATARASADTQALFITLWTNIPDALCPVLPGGRGVSAVNDFTAHKTLKLPLALGRALAVAGAGAGLTAHALGSVAGEETHTLTASEQASMGVGGSMSGSGSAGSAVTSVDTTGGSAQTAGGEPVGTINSVTPHANALPVSVSGSISGTASGGGQPHNNIAPTSFWNVMVKL